jgi:hypothetical protein
MGRSWVPECLLPLVYWAPQAAHTRCARRKAKLRKALESVPAMFHTHAPPGRSPPKGLRLGKRGPRSGHRPFSGHHLLWKGSMALGRRGITISEACPSVDTRCGQSYTTLMVELQRARRQRRDFSGGPFRISLKRGYPTSRSCLSLGDENTMQRYVIEVMAVSRFKWIPRSPSCCARSSSPNSATCSANSSSNTSESCL